MLFSSYLKPAKILYVTQKSIVNEIERHHYSQRWYSKASSKKLDNVRLAFKEDACNVRLGLATDEFDPCSDKSHPYSMRQVVLIPYNVSSEMCLKDTNYLLFMLIFG